MVALTASTACPSGGKPVDFVASSELHRHLRYLLELSAWRAGDLIVQTMQARPRLL